MRLNVEKVIFRSVESTQAGHSRRCTGTLSLLGIKQFPEHKKCAEGDQPAHPAVKYSLGTAENKWQQSCTVAAVKLNRTATAKKRVLVAWPKDPLSKNTPSSAKFLVAFEQLLVPAATMPIPINSQLFQKVLQSTLKIVRHHLKGSVLIAALLED